MLNIKTIIIAVFCFSIGILTSQLLGDKLATQKNFSENRLKSHYKFVNPLLECDTYGVSQDTNLDHLKNKVTKTIDNKVEQHQIDFASVYYRDMNNGPWFGISEREKFSPASLIKVPIMMTYYKLAETDKTILDKKIVNNIETATNIQDIKPEVTLTPNKEYTVDELITNMIKYSDNDAYTLLVNNIEASKIHQTFSDLGVDISDANNNPNGDIITVKAYASFFRILYNASYLNPEMSDRALSLLETVSYKTAINSPIPQSIKVSHKYGERYFEDTGVKQFHDCGIVYLPGKPYLICIMTRGKNFDKLTTTISDISKIIYDDISKN